ncbi:MAG: protein kinase [Myxococcota bacterium]
MVEDSTPTPDASRDAEVPGSFGGRAPSIGNGRYTLVSKIAEGGMAGVYRAWDHKLRTWRAIKVLLPEYTQRDILRSRFEGEAKTMARLDHPHVIRVYDVGTKEALPYMVMELAEGGTVNGWVDEWGPMPPRLAAQVLIDVAHGLAASHALGVVHRDVKPHNVLVTADGTCKVTDFGIARGALGDLDQTRTGATMGTIGYMAPEQRSDAKLVDERADVYSLGALLYKLLVGRVVTDLFLVEHEPKLLDDVAEPLREVILRACYHDRERRYPNAVAMIRALLEIRSALPEDPPDTPALPIPIPGPPGPNEIGGDGFPEIGILIGLAPPPKRTPVPLPYTMSRPPPKRRVSTPAQSDVDDLPGYIDVVSPPSLPVVDPPDGDPRPLELRNHRTPPTAQARSTPSRAPQASSNPTAGRTRTSAAPAPEASAKPSSPTPSAKSAAKSTAKPAAKSAGQAPTKAPTKSAAKSKPDLSARVVAAAPPFVTGLALATIFLWGTAFVLTGYGAWEVRHRAAESTEATEAVRAVIVDEEELLQELSLHGSPASQELTQLYDAVAASHAGFPRRMATATYLTAVLAESERTFGDQPSQLSMIRVRNLSKAWTRYHNAQVRWRRAAAWPQGWLATHLGLAPAPGFEDLL